MNPFSRIVLIALLWVAPVTAQTQKTATTPGNSTSSGDLTINTNGVRLDANAKGPARVTSPQLDVAARSIALDKKGSEPPTQVRATGNVNFKLNITPGSAPGSATSSTASGTASSTPAHIEATCDSAVLTPRPLRLVLKGNLKGFYQVAGGAKNTLSGDTAVFTNTGGNLLADLTGGVTLVVPAGTLGQPGMLGEVTITAQRAQINESDGTATFVGNARAVSAPAVGSANAFDVTAPRFTLTRQSDGTLSNIKTTGRTLVKLDLPPDPAPPTSTSAAPAVAPGAAPKFSLGQPTHVEVAADGATLEPANSKRAASTATFEGNVKGFYRLAPNPSPQNAPAQNAGPQNYDFAGTLAVIRYAPTPGSQNALAGFNLEVSGATVEGPAFDLNF